MSRRLFLRYGSRGVALAYLATVAVIAIGKRDWDPLLVVAVSMWIAYQAGVEGGKT